MSSDGAAVGDKLLRVEGASDGGGLLLSYLRYRRRARAHVITILTTEHEDGG